MTGKEQTVVQEVLEVIPAVMRVIRKEFRSRRDPELTLPEFRGMLHINRSPGCALNEVAEYIGLEAPAASKLVDHLVQRGLVRRQEDASDRRRVKLSILPKGKQRIEAAVEHTRHFLAKRLAHLSSTERQTLLDTMQILKAAFASEANRPKEKEAHPSS
jgi:DNA-binding MarR family transcriptional regulator